MSLSSVFAKIEAEEDAIIPHQNLSFSKPLIRYESPQTFVSAGHHEKTELIAELSNRQVGRELAADLGRLGGVTAALFAELDVDIAHAVATNAVENNFLASKEFKGAAKKTQSNPEEEEEALSPSDASSKNMATKLGRNFAEKIGQSTNSMVSLENQLQRKRVTRHPEGHADMG